jgi:DNA-entry nuclease
LSCRPVSAILREKFSQSSFGEEAKLKKKIFAVLLALTLFVSAGCGAGEGSAAEPAGEPEIAEEDASVAAKSEDSSEQDSEEDSQEQPEEVTDGEELSVPEYTSAAYATVNGNVPFFTEDDLTTEPFEDYSELDDLGRCQVAFANICKELMPTEERGEIGQIRPTGWHTVKYNGCVEGNYLYNRCHLIGYQLAGENANEKNLITGTRYLNVEGMLPFENEVADYIDDNPENHVLYRVTPIFTGDDLLADGVLMEAYSVEDGGAGVEFCVFCYNVQPGILIDYETGESSLDENYVGEYVTGSSGSKYSANLADAEEESGDADTAEETDEDTAEEAAEDIAEEMTYIINTNTGKFHYPDCRSVKQMAEKNAKEVTASRDTLIDEGYSPCGNCKP